MFYDYRKLWSWTRWRPKRAFECADPAAATFLRRVVTEKGTSYFSSSFNAALQVSSTDIIILILRVLLSIFFWGVSDEANWPAAPRTWGAWRHRLRVPSRSRVLRFDLLEAIAIRTRASMPRSMRRRRYLSTTLLREKRLWCIIFLCWSIRRARQTRK